MVEVLDFGLEVNEFKLQSYYYIKFWIKIGKAMNSFILLALGGIVSLLFFYKDGFDIKLFTKVDMPFNKESKCFQQSNIYLSVLSDVWRKLYMEKGKKKYSYAFKCVF